MADGGKLIIKIDLDDTNFKKVSKGLGNVATKALKGFAVGVASLSVAMIGIGKSAIEAYANYEQLVGGVETLFKDSAGIIQQYAKEAYKTAGISANQYMETATSFSASLIQSLGGDTKKAAEYANMAITDMSDNANKMGTSMESLIMTYQSLSRGNFAMLDNLKLGYGGTRAEMERLIADASRLDKSIKANDMSFANIVKSINVVQKNMGILGTTSKEASTTIQGSLGMVKASWENLMVGIADPEQDFDKLVQEFVDSVVTFGQNLAPRIKIVLKGVVDLFKALAPEIGQAILDLLPEMLGSFGTVLSKVLGFIGKNIKPITKIVLTLVTAFMTLKAVSAISMTINAVNASLVGLGVGASGATKAMAGLNAVMSANPFGAVLAAIGLLISAIMWFTTETEEAKSAVQELEESYDSAIASIDEATSKEMVQAEKVQTLKEKLYELDDELKKETTTEKKAIGIRKEFNSVAQELSQIIPGITNSLYNENGQIDIQRGKINQLADSYYALAKAKAYSNAYSKKLEETITSKLNLENRFEQIAPGVTLDDIASGKYDIKGLWNDGGVWEYEDYMLDSDLRNRYNVIMKKDAKNLPARDRTVTTFSASDTKEFKEAVNLWKEFTRDEDKYLQGMVEWQQKYEELGGKQDDVTNTYVANNEKQAESEEQKAKEIEEAREKELRDMKFYHNVGMMDDKTYYDELTKFRDKYFDVGTSEWQSYTEEIYRYNKNLADETKKQIQSTFDEMVKQAYDKVDEVEQLQKGFADKLKGYGELFTVETQESWYRTKEIVKLGDMAKQNEALQKYADLLLQVKERGNVPQEFFATLRDLSVEDGTKFAEALLKADDKTFNEYIEGWKEKQKTADEISTMMYADETKKAEKEIENSLSQFNQDLIQQGKDNASSWAKGFIQEIKAKMPTVLDSINSAFGNIVHAPSYAMAGSINDVQYPANFIGAIPQVMINGKVELNGREVGKMVFEEGMAEAKRRGSKFFE